MKADEGYVENKVSDTYRFLCDILIGIYGILLTNCRNALRNSDSDKQVAGTDGTNWSK